MVASSFSKTDFTMLVANLYQKPIQGCMLDAQRVPRSRTLIVSNTGPLTSDGLTAYFGNFKLSGGSGDVKVELNRKDRCALVTFETFESTSWKTIKILAFKVKSSKIIIVIVFILVQIF